MVNNCTNHRLPYAVFLVFAVAVVLNIYFLHSLEEVVVVAGKASIEAHTHSLSAILPDLSCPFDVHVPSMLLPGDLPGYTGWPRQPSLTLPNYSMISIGGVSVVDDSSIPEDKLVHHIADPTIGGIWSVVVYCPTKECQDSSPAFYARSYGPAIITGDIRTVRISPVGSEDKNNVAYEVQFRYRFPGNYIVELVLESEDAIPLSNFPRKMAGGLQDMREPTYKGWMMPGFPLQIEAIDSTSRENSSLHPSKRWCSAEEIVADTTGQWVVTGRYDQKLRDSGKDSTLIGSSMLRDYQSGFNSIGACTKYVLGSNCELLSTESLGSGKEMENALSQCMMDANATVGAPMRIVLIGDSVTQALRTMLNNEFSVQSNGLIQVEFVNTKEGIPFRLEEIKTTLKNLRIQHPNNRFIVIFNAGLHDIKWYCLNEFVQWRKDHNLPPDWKYGDCLESYKHHFTILVDFIGQWFPAELKIFRTTNAGWMRWGNFGFAWRADESQAYIMSPHYVKLFNTAAVDIVKQSGHNIDIIDFYHITLSRPDNTEIKDPNNPIAPHLVHPGVASLQVLARKLMMLIMWHICGSTIERLEHL